MKNLVIAQIENNIKDIKSANSAMLVNIMHEATKIFEVQMSYKQAQLTKLITALENSRELTDVENDEYAHQWLRVDFSELIDLDSDLEKELLSEYLNENYHTYVNYEFNTISQCIGPAILVDLNEGNAYDQDSGKQIIQRGEYSTKTEFFQAIEVYMEKSGYYPSVVQVNKYGVMGYIDTSKYKA